MFSRLSSIYEQAAGLSAVMQGVHDNLPQSAKLAVSGVAGGASSLKEGIYARIGARRTVRSPTGPKEIAEVGLVSESPNVSKVRCMASDTEFALKRIEASHSTKQTSDSEAPTTSTSGQSNLVTLEALQGLADRADLLPKLPEHQNLVRVLSSTSDNTGMSHAQLFLMELCEESLADMRARRGEPLHAEEVIHIVQDIANALCCLHTGTEKPLPVIHGSVQAEHVLRGTSGSWKLGSFGNTHVGASASDVKDDIQQLGEMAFELLFGVPPSADTVVLPIPQGRPKGELDGRLIVLLHWLMAADPRHRPTAKQLAVAADYMASTSASKLRQALPAPVVEALRGSLQALVDKELRDAVDAIDGSDRRILINKYGEGIIKQPNTMSPALKNRVCSPEQIARMKDLPALLGMGDEQADEKLCAELAGGMSAEDEESVPQLQPAPCCDLLDMTQFSLIDFGEEKEEKPKEVDSMDLFDPFGQDSSPVASQEATPTAGSGNDGALIDLL